MNIQHMRYAIEVARLGSLNQASESLLVAQPNLSRAIRELESDLGIRIFRRSAKGMTPTVEGEEFLIYAREILNQIGQVERYYKQGAPVKQRLSVSAHRACYISDAFAAFSGGLDGQHIELFYHETNSGQTVNHVLNEDYRIGIIRYSTSYDGYFKKLLEEKGLCYEIIAEFSHLLVLSKHHPLATQETIRQGDLVPYMQITSADPYVPSLSYARVMKEEQNEAITRRIYVFERASQLDLLSQNHQTFMWASPLSEKMLARYDLVQRTCEENHRVHRDVLIWREGYRLTPLERAFIAVLKETKKRYLL